jgi:hypothetical protein
LYHLLTLDEGRTEEGCEFEMRMKSMRTVHNLEGTEANRKRLRREATPQEIILWSRLRRDQLGAKFRRQHAIGKYIVDFYCSEYLSQISPHRKSSNKACP